MLKPPSREASVLRYMLEGRAAEAPDEVLAIFQQTGESWTNREFLEKSRSYAAAFQKLGVKQGDFVLSWLPNGPHALLVYMGLAYLGAVYTPINTAYRGSILAHVIENAAARLMAARTVQRSASASNDNVSQMHASSARSSTTTSALAAYGASANDAPITAVVATAASPARRQARDERPRSGRSRSI